MNSDLFNGLANFLKQNSGLVITPDKAYLVSSRLQPVALSYACKNIEELIVKLLSNPSGKLKQDVVEAMTTNETSFFRDNVPFEIFKNHVLSDMIEKRKARKALRILCLASSSGQEPYSLAMLLAENAGRLSGWKTDILGVDIDTRILSRAEEAIYSQFEVQRGLPINLLLKYFDQLPNQAWRLKPTIRNLVRFQKCNLLEPLSGLGQFDVIFCRNVLIYFDAPTKRDVLNRVANQVAPDGFLFLGGAETVLDISSRFTPVTSQRGVYTPQLSNQVKVAVGA